MWSTRNAIERLIEVDENTIKIVDQNSQEIQVRATTFDGDSDIYSIKLSRTVVPGEKLVVSMNYKGPLYLDLMGMYWSDYEDGGKTQ